MSWYSSKLKTSSYSFLAPQLKVYRSNHICIISKCPAFNRTATASSLSGLGYDSVKKFHPVRRIHCIPIFQIKTCQIFSWDEIQDRAECGKYVINLENLVPNARLEAFRAIKFSRLESFRALELYDQNGWLKVHNTLQIALVFSSVELI